MRAATRPRWGPTSSTSPASSSCQRRAGRVCGLAIPTARTPAWRRRSPCGAAHRSRTSAPALEIERARLEELRLAVVEDEVDAALALGRHEEVVPRVEALVRTHPTRERLRRQLMLALYRSGRQAEALEAYRDARRSFVRGARHRARRGATRARGRDPAAGSRARAGSSRQPRPEHRVPAPATPLVGRGREVAEISALLADGARLVTLTGPGGSGKTRLALQAAEELAGRFADGIFFVGLAALEDAALVPAEIARALGVEDARDPSSGARRSPPRRAPAPRAGQLRAAHGRRDLRRGVARGGAGAQAPRDQPPCASRLWRARVSRRATRSRGRGGAAVPAARRSPSAAAWRRTR